MKKVISLMLCLLMLCFACTALAAEYQPGDTVTVYVSITSNDSGSADGSIRVNTKDTDVLQFVSGSGKLTMGGLAASFPPQKNGASFALMSADMVSPIPTGSVGTVQYRIAANAAPGTYRISVTSGVFGVSGGVTVVIPEPDCEHTFGAWTVTTEATCTDDGVETRECSLCGEKETRDIAATDHAYDDGVQTKAPTCKEEGEMTVTCAKCGDTYTEAIAKSDKHAWDEGVIEPAPTCLVDGVKTFTCTVCGLTDETVIAAPGKHTYDAADLTTEVDPTCTENGKGSYTCTACNEKIDGGVIPALNHNYTSQVTTEPSCGKEGVKTFTCSRCDDTYTEKIDALEHAYTSEVTTEPTCGKAGAETYTCSKCGDTYTEEIDATGKHTYDEQVTTEPSCGKEGVKTFTCSVCGDTYTEKIDALEHEYTSEVTTEPTCGAAGVKTYTCSKCGDTYTEEIGATGEHTYGEAVQTKAPTCTDKGEQTSTCSVCGDVKTEEVAALGHTEEVVPAVEPTCTETGLTEGKKCSVCGTELVKQKTVKAKGHKKGDWVVVKEPTEEEKGLKERYCTVCGVTLESKTFTLSSVTFYPNNTACAMGPAFRDESKLTKKWYRFTPIDLSVDGEQTFDLIASNLYIIGQVKVTVAEGNVTVEVKYNSNGIVVHNEFCTFLPSLAETTTLDMAELKNYAFGTPISIENDLAGDTRVLLFICNEIDYNTGMNITLLPYKTKEFKQQIEDMKLLMD